VDVIETHNVDWEKETQRRCGLVAKYFKPKEIQTIQDFIVTAKDVSKEENENKEGVKSGQKT
jgi:phosphoribosyl 1,2-cyclic phosphodiesterase